MATSLLAPAQVDYPSSDGRPMAESDHQRTPLTYAVDRLRHHFRDRDDVYVSGNLLIYYEEGNVGARVAPDVFVVVGAPNRDRSSYLLWKEAEGAGLRAGDHVAEDLPGGPGAQAGVVPFVASAGVLVLHPA